MINELQDLYESALQLVMPNAMPDRDWKEYEKIRAKIEELKKPKMRYFLFLFTYKNGDGTILMERESMPSEKGMASTVRRENDLHESEIIYISNIFEFKSKEDYENFTK